MAGLKRENCHLNEVLRLVESSSRWLVSHNETGVKHSRSKNLVLGLAWVEFVSGRVKSAVLNVDEFDSDKNCSLFWFSSRR